MPKWTDKVQQDDFDRATERALTRIGMLLEERAVYICPKDTGRLQGSITWATMRNKDAVRPPAGSEDAVSKPSNKYTLHVGTNVKYAPYMEYGTIHTPAQSYLRPAMSSGRGPAQKIFNDELKRMLRGQ